MTDPLQAIKAAMDESFSRFTASMAETLGTTPERLSAMAEIVAATEDGGSSPLASYQCRCGKILTDPTGRAVENGWCTGNIFEPLLCLPCADRDGLLA